jgi:hypothetical protein
MGSLELSPGEVVIGVDQEDEAAEVVMGVDR